VHKYKTAQAADSRRARILVPLKGKIILRIIKN
jgi:hypothetical protein